MTNLDDMLNQTPTLTLEGIEPEKQEAEEVKNAVMAPEAVAKAVVENRLWIASTIISASKAIIIYFVILSSPP